MLVSKKQEWDVYQEQTAPTATCSPKPNISLRKKCLKLVTLAAVMAMIVTVQSEAIVRAGYDLVQTKAQATKLEKENDQLRLDISRLKSPQRIQHIATAQLGMVVPQNVYCATTTSTIAERTPANDKTGAGQRVDLVKASKAEASKGR